MSSVMFYSSVLLIIKILRTSLSLSLSRSFCKLVSYRFVPISLKDLLIYLNGYFGSEICGAVELLWVILRAVPNLVSMLVILDMGEGQ